MRKDDPLGSRLSVVTRVWLDAGHVTTRVDLAGERLTSRRGRSSRPPRRPARLYGCMQGTLTLAEGVDLASPADPHWAEVYADG